MLCPGVRQASDVRLRTLQQQRPIRQTVPPVVGIGIAVQDCVLRPDIGVFLRIFERHDLVRFALVDEHLASKSA